MAKADSRALPSRDAWGTGWSISKVIAPHEAAFARQQTRSRNPPVCQ
jgi:hypothetical protein